MIVLGEGSKACACFLFYLDCITLKQQQYTAVKIKNYRSTVPAEKSILHIEKILIEMGARNIAKEYDDKGKVISISFSNRIGERLVPFQLPAKREPIKKLFLSEYKRPTQLQSMECERQAERTAWKNVKEWTELQATMIKLEQVEFMEVFMSYAYSIEKGVTLFEHMKANDFKQLPQ